VAAGHHPRLRTQDRRAVADQADQPQVDSRQAVQAGVLPQAVTDHPDRTDPPQAAVTPPVLLQEVPAVTQQAEVRQVHILPAVQAVVAAAIPEAGSPAADHPEVQADPTAVAAAPEAAEEEGNH